MQRSFVLSLALLCVVSGLSRTAFVYAEPVITPSPATLTAEGQVTAHTRAIVSGEYAYLLGQPEVVAADIKLQKFGLSPTGDAVLIAAYKKRPFHGVVLTSERMDTPVGELNLIYWDTRTRIARTLFREAVREDVGASIEQIEWLPGTRTALVVLYRFTSSRLPQTGEELSSYSLLRVDTTTGKISRITELASGQGAYSRPDFVSASSSQPLAYIRTQEGTGAKSGPFFRTSLRVCTSQGLRASLTLPDGTLGFTWLPDGKSIYSDRIVEKDTEGKIKARKVLTLVNLETGEVTHPNSLPVIPKTERGKEVPSPREMWPVTVALTNTPLKDPAGQSQIASSLWLRSSAPHNLEPVPTVPANRGTGTDSLLIATNAHRETEIATENTAAILFTRDGSLCAAPIFRLPLIDFEKALHGAQRMAAIDNAKQVGLALLNYIQDNDLKFPPSDGNVADQIGSYVRNPDIFQNPATGENGFVFSYQGPRSQSQIENPGITQLGYVSGPGGRAIIWADGHVTWENN